MVYLGVYYSDIKRNEVLISTSREMSKIKKYCTKFFKAVTTEHICHDFMHMIDTETNPQNGI